MNFFEKQKQKSLLKKVNKLGPKYSKMSDEELKEESNKLMALARNGASINKLEAEAFALAREASWRVLHKKHYDVQVIGGHVLHTGNVAEMSTGSGKAVPMDTPIPTTEGWKLASEIRVGDFLFDKNGLPTEVEGVFPQGLLDTYNITLSDGRSQRCADSHIWTVYDYNTVNSEMLIHDLTTEEIINSKDRVFFVPNNGPVQYSKKEFKIKPFIFGKSFVLQRGKINSIPTEYKLGSVKQRKNMIRGMFEGSVIMYPPKKGFKYVPRITVFSEEAKDDVMEVLYSLGISSKFMTVNSGKSGKERFLIEPKEHPVNIYKLLGNRIAKKCNFTVELDDSIMPKNKIKIKSIEKLPEKTEQVCFSVKNDDHLFLVGKYIVTHNTLTEVLPAYLNALSGKGVHIITVNDYLAKRDMEEMGKIFKFLGMTVAWLNSDMDTAEKQAAYACDIIYGTNSEFGFDYLRDNMVKDASKRVQRELNYCVIDEVDSIMIDEARTPLIISSSGEESTDIYKLASNVARVLVRGEDEKEMTKLEKIDISSRELNAEEIEAKKDFQVNEKYSTITLTDRGINKIEKMLNIKNLGDDTNAVLYHNILQAVRAHFLMKKNVDYIVADGEVLIIDASTGRTMVGRRFSDGLHQALEAKENVAIQAENTTAATITLQNYFRLYDKISGMTGTAKTEEKEFMDIYGMKILPIPEHKPRIRKDLPDIIYASKIDKEHAIYLAAKEAKKQGRPVLIGTSSIEASESLSKYFKSKHFNHELLNAKSTFNQSISSATKEALIIAQAGQAGKVTIATNMAGRGTDILLGGNPEHLAVQTMLNCGYSEDLIKQAQNFVLSDDETVKDAQLRYQKILENEKIACEKNKEFVVQAGGLCVIGTEKHDSRRVDNQLRGRAGRQGDPGSSQFIISLEDRLFKTYGGSMVEKLAKNASGSKDALYSGGMMAKVIDKCQKNVEAQGFQQRKDVLEYDEIDSVQREEVYKLRNKLLDGLSIKNEFSRFIEYGCIAFEELTDEEILINKKLENVHKELTNKNINRTKFIKKYLNDVYKSIESLDLEDNAFDHIKTQAMLMSLDTNWHNHIITLQNLKESSRMASYGQLQPIEIYKREASESFQNFKMSVGRELVTLMLSMKIVIQ